jgi:hypothetical protein
MRTSEIIRKADMTIGDLASGGLLEDEQAAAFIRKLHEFPTMLNMTRQVTMSSPQRQINKIGFGSRIMRAGVSATPLGVSDRSKPTTEQVLLVSKESIAEVRLPYDVIEDQIEQGHNLGVNQGMNSGDPVTGSFADTIITLMAQRAALDLEELMILGDTGSGDTYLAQLDGLLVQATSNVLDAAGAPVNRTLFKNAMQTMPSQYLRDRVSQRHFLSVNNETEYRDQVANRETALGDAQANGDTRVRPFGVTVEPVALMPGDQGLMTLPANIIWGIQRQISIEVDKDIQSRVFIIVLTIRNDFKFEEEEAVVKFNNISGS